MRIESTVEDFTLVSIYDFARNVVIVLEPDDRFYTETAWPDDSLSAWFALGDNDPCGAQESEHITARNLGFETLRGRRVEKWHCSDTTAEDTNPEWTVWHDPSLPWPFVRIEGRDGMITNMLNIHVGPQPAELFQVPPGYTKREPLEGTMFQVAPGHTEADPSEGLVIRELPD